MNVQPNFDAFKKPLTWSQKTARRVLTQLGFADQSLPRNGMALHLVWPGESRTIKVDCAEGPAGQFYTFTIG
jgi:hypothetical protein